MYIGEANNERDLMENRWVKEGVNQKEMGRAKLSMGNGKWMCRIEDMFVDGQHMATSNISDLPLCFPCR